MDFAEVTSAGAVIAYAFYWVVIGLGVVVGEFGAFVLGEGLRVGGGLGGLAAEREVDGFVEGCGGGGLGGSGVDCSGVFGNGVEMFWA